MTEKLSSNFEVETEYFLLRSQDFLRLISPHSGHLESETKNRTLQKFACRSQIKKYLNGKEKHFRSHFRILIGSFKYYSFPLTVNK